MLVAGEVSAVDPYRAGRAHLPSGRLAALTRLGPFGRGGKEQMGQALASGPVHPGIIIEVVGMADDVRYGHE